MKWIYMIVILIIGGMLVYYLFIAREAEPGTPKATAQDFMKAALKNDLEKAKSLCKPEAQNGLEPIFQRIQAAKPDPLAIQYSNMNAKPPYRGILVSFLGVMIPIEMIQEGDAWKIANISIN